MVYYSLIIALSLFVGSVQASNLITEEDEKIIKKPTCQSSANEIQGIKNLVKEIQDTNKTLVELNEKPGQFPSGTISTYQQYLADLLKLHERAAGGEDFDVEEELYYATQRNFSPGEFY